MTAAPRLRYPSAAAEAAIATIAGVARALGGRAWLVGGCVRDALLELALRDLDVEVFGVAPDALEAGLAGRVPASLVGRSFPVWKVHGQPIDVSVPRIGSEWDTHATPERAAARRDYTINAIALDPESGERVDPFDGTRDIEARVLRHVSERFDEDPLRVLRGMQLVARLELSAAPDTIRRCRRLQGSVLPRERVFGEWKKLLLEGVRPSLGLAFLEETRWLRDTPELEALIGCPQDPQWHPEGDVWTHTGHCLDAFAEERSGVERDDLVVGLAVLCHDLGKPETTQLEDGRVRAKRHDRAGEARTRTLLARWTDEDRLVEEVVPLVGAHLAPVQLFEAQSSDRAIRRLARRVGRIDRLVRVARADQYGRPPLPHDGFPAGRWLLERASALRVASAPPEPIVTGRDLIERGIPPGPTLGALLERCFEAQIEGRFETREEGIALAERWWRAGSRSDA